ncbi:MAG: endonuclease/exonuclease/phosphatase family protein [Rhodothermaceae bacterium]|nr:endonuclease/exonuclease/phosphatase family protein [Rhodothermaceae bacterium]
MRRFLWSAFLIIDSFLVVWFVAGFLARWIDPRLLWWPQLFAIVLPFTSIILSLLGLALLYKRKWSLFTTHLIIMVMVGTRFLSFHSLPAPSTIPNSDALRVSSYNLGQLESLTQPELAEKLSEVLQLISPDVLCLQEFLIRYRGDPLRFRNLPSVAAMFDSLGFQVVADQKHAVSHSFKPVFTQRSILSMISKERLALSDEETPELSVLRTVVNWKSREVAIYNVHLQTFGERKPWSETTLSPLNPSFWSQYVSQYRDAFLDRAWQADKIHELIQKEPLPFMIVGDFNSTPHNWTFNRIATGLQDVYTEAGLKRKMSYHARFPVVRIDHVLVSDDWDVVSADILPLKHSDHRPLVVELRLAE